VLVEVDGNFIDTEQMKQIRRRDDKGIPGTLVETYCIQNSQTKDPHPQQQSISGIQEGNPKESSEGAIWDLGI
jgi:hypothetical protein